MYSPVDEIKSRLDVVELIQGYIKVQKAGRNYRACCPFHSEKTPSLMISTERQIWHCFGCGKGGSVFDFVMEMEGLEFSDALQMLAKRAGVELKDIAPELRNEKSQLYEICDLAVRFFIKQLESKAGKNIQQYLNKRGLKPETIQEWKIGYAPGEWRSLSGFLKSRGYDDKQILKTGLTTDKGYDRFRDRIIFPIFDLNGIPVGFTGRENPSATDSKMGKYINISNTLIYDKSRILYGLDKAKADIRNNACILVEGQMDVIMSHQAGFKNAVASSGTALTEEHLKIIKRYTDKLIMSFDSDTAGEMATKRGIDLAIQFGFNVEIAGLSGKDPADCILQDVSLWSEAIEKSQKIMEFYLASAFERNDPSTVDGKKKICSILLPAVKKIPNKIEQTHWLQQIGRRISVQENVLIEAMKDIKNDYRLKKETPANVKRDIPDKEEYLLGLILSDSKNLKKVKDEPSEIFTNPDLKKIFNKLKKGKKLPKEQVDYLAFRAEAYRDLSEANTEKEIKDCLEKIKEPYRRKQIILCQEKKS